MNAKKKNQRTPAATGPKSGDVARRRPRKSDKGHTLVTRTVWTSRNGREQGRWECQCGKTLRVYIHGDVDRVDASHARHAARATS